MSMVLSRRLQPFFAGFFPVLAEGAQRCRNLSHALRTNGTLVHVDTAEAVQTVHRRSWTARRGRGRGRGRGGSHQINETDFDPNAIFKVFTTHCEPYYTMPWSTSPQTTSAASAFALEVGGKRYLLTNAHAVHHASLVELQRPGEDCKFLATVVCRGPDCDLALLEIDSEEATFWDGVEPLKLCSEVPALNDHVSVCGYPVGGENASMTQGVVSRVELHPYRHGLGSLLAIQIDAAINPGNSGGPVLDSRQRCVGVAFQSLKDGDTENIGYVIPTEVLEHFITGYQRSGRYAGFGHHGFAWQPLDNRALREAVGATTGGVLIKRVEPTTPAARLLNVRDVLMSIGGRAIGSGGTVHFRHRERITFPYVTGRLCPGDEVEIEVMRMNGNGQRQLHRWQLELAWPRPLVPMHPPQPPAYVVFGGLVFVPLSEPYLRSEWGDAFEERAPVCLVEPWLRNVPCVAGEEVVVLSCVFASPLTAGLTHFTNRRLLKCNSISVRNLLHLAALIDASDTTSLLFELDEDDIIALPRLDALDVTAEVLRANLVPNARCLPADQV